MVRARAPHQSAWARRRQADCLRRRGRRTAPRGALLLLAAARVLAEAAQQVGAVLSERSRGRLERRDSPLRASSVRSSMSTARQVATFFSTRAPLERTLRRVIKGAPDRALVPAETLALVCPATRLAARLASEREAVTRSTCAERPGRPRAKRAPPSRGR